MKEGAANAEYWVTNGFRIPGCINEKIYHFSSEKKMREFLGYAGYFRASRYGKFLLTQVNAFGSKANSKFSLNYMILMCN